MAKSMIGIVLKSTGSWYEVRLPTGERARCRLLGKMRLTNSKESNPVGVGDRVEIMNKGEDYFITNVLERTNHLLRKSVKKSTQTHVLAANLDVAIVMATLKLPRTSLGFIDRILATAEAYGISQYIIFNKIDLLSTPEELDALQKITALYANLGIPTSALSVTNDNLEALRTALAGKICLLCGHSGVGKSTLINRLAPAARQTVQDVSSFSNKGMHTTTFVEMFDIGNNTFIIDSPGIQEWGLADVTAQELSDYFPEMRALRNDCKFGASCLHWQEPSCAVLQAVAKGTIVKSRYDSYYSILQGEDNRK